jgi:hypothetical protein
MCSLLLQNNAEVGQTIKNQLTKLETLLAESKTFPLLGKVLKY